MGFSLLVIDPQIDFHYGSLAVVGANQDSANIANFIRSEIDNIDSIIITLDTHFPGHIAQSCFWEDQGGRNPAAFSIISHSDVLEGKWRPRDITLQEYCCNYTRDLEAKGRFQLTIWPDHCLGGSEGHEIVPDLKTAIHLWEDARKLKMTTVCKGQNLLTEMYSVFQAEVPLENDASTQLNEDLLQLLKTQNKILICGQALSHCVNYTLRDLVQYWSPRETQDLFLITDGSSSVTGYESQSATFVQDMAAAGVRITTFKELLEEKLHLQPTL